MLLKLQTSSTKSTMLLETSEDKLSAREEAFEDAQFGLQVRNCVARKGLKPCVRENCLTSKIVECLFDQLLPSSQSHLIENLMCYSLTNSFNL